MVEAIGYEWLVNCGRRDSTARVAHLLCETAERMHIHNGHLAELWLGGLTLFVPAALVTALRVLPPRVLTRAGLVEEEL